MMAYKNEMFSAMTQCVMLPEDAAIPLSPAAENDLMALLSEDGDYTFASLRSDTKYEAVRIQNNDGLLVVTRGIAGTQAEKHPFGTCVSLAQPAVIAAVKDLICNFNCCEDEPCECVPVAVGGSILPTAYRNLPWNGTVSFTGDMPMALAVDMRNAKWINAVQNGNAVHLSGTPPETGRYSFSVSASNCNGKVATKACEVVVEILDQ